MAARGKIQNLQQACEDCDYERQKQLDQDLVEVIGKCSLNSQVSSSYCEGFNLEVKMRTIDWKFNDRAHGLFQGFTNIIIALMFAAVGYMPDFPCIERDAESRSIIASIYAFADDYPELLQLDSQTTFLTKALFYGLCPGPKEHLSPHMEHCTNWENKKGSLNLVTDNNCSKPIYIQFKTDSSPVIEGKIDPGERFNTEHYSTRYIYTACRSGYASSVPLSKENWETISRNHYHCVKE